MKKLIILLIIFIFYSCEKQYKCHREVTKTVKGKVVYYWEEDYYVDYITCNKCSNYEYLIYDTIYKSETKCK
jgi:hypothetical protein